MEKFSIPSDEMEKIPSNKIPENKPESVSEAVVSGGFGVSLSLGFVLIGIILSLTGIGIIIGLPMILIGLVGAFGIAKDTVKDSVELATNKKQ